MLTRRHIRAKVMQAVYAYRQSDMQDIAVARKNLILGIETIEELYSYQYSLLLAVKDMASARIEARRGKRLATAEDLNPNLLFVENPVFAFLEENKTLRRLAERFSSPWQDRSEYVELCYNEFLQSSEYEEYMQEETPTFIAHKKIVIFLFKKIIAPMEAVADYYEDCHKEWVGDLQVANSMLLKTITDIYEDIPVDEMEIPTLFKDILDRDFAVKLLERTIEKGPSYRPMIEEKLRNWDAERIAMVDFILMEMAVVEFMLFNTIPAKVTLNEYIEVAKEYSTVKSSVFINGVLDRLMESLTKEGKIQKSGRGLM
ncbi:MAG: transcription antitermination protein NusB [Flavobacteriales bacterium]|nr:transcription antitermination protein NusB [Flavobacteriales bacterium]